MTKFPPAQHQSHIRLVCYDTQPLRDIRKQFELLLTVGSSLSDVYEHDEGYFVLYVVSEREGILQSCLTSFKSFIKENGYGNFDLEECSYHHSSIMVNFENLLRDELETIRLNETVKRSSEKIVVLAKEIVALKGVVSRSNKEVSELKDFIANQTLQYETLLKILDQTNLNFQALGLPTIESYYVEIH